MEFLDSAPKLDQPVTVSFPDLLGPAGTATGDGMPTLRILIDGAWQESGGGRRST